MKVKQMISNGMTYAHVVRKGNLNFHVVIRVLYSVILNFVKIVRKEKNVAKIIRIVAQVIKTIYKKSYELNKLSFIEDNFDQVFDRIIIHRLCTMVGDQLFGNSYLL